MCGHVVVFVHPCCCYDNSVVVVFRGRRPRSLEALRALGRGEEPQSAGFIAVEEKR
jgi:hypothetical protein